MVTDFGIARARAGETRITATGVAVGTPAYMSPEQALGEREVDGRSDLYSLAVVAYHMLSGDTPFKAVNTPAMLVKHVSERPRPIRERRPDVPAYLAVAIDRALAKKPEDRWSDAAEFRDALAGAQASHRRRQAWTPPSSQIPPYPGGESRNAPPAAALVPAPAQAPSPPRHFPLPPPGISRKELRRWYKAQRNVLRAEERAAFDREIRVIGINLESHKRFDERPLDERVDSFRHSVMSWMGWSGVLVFINAAMTQGPPWFLVPSGLLFLNVLAEGQLDLVRRRRSDRRLQERNPLEAARRSRRCRGAERNRGAATAAARAADDRAARGPARAGRRARRPLSATRSSARPPTARSCATSRASSARSRRS